MLQTNIARALTYNDSFTYDMGLNIAVGLTRYDSDVEPFDDPTVGEVVFNHYKWGTAPDGQNFAGRYPLKSHRCTREELGLDDDKSKARFYPNTDSDVEFYHKKFLCIDKEDIEVYGDWNSHKAQLLNVQFIKCHDRPDCKS